MKKFVGIIGVDSGQIVICDPCYIDSQWKEEKFENNSRYKVIADGTILEYPKDFSNYGVVIEQYGKDMNQMIKEKLVEEFPAPPAKHNFSYNACCKATLSPDGFGQLNYEIGHPGIAVASCTCYGDGMYPVYANVDNHGRVKSIIIDFLNDTNVVDEE